MTMTTIKLPDGEARAYQTGSGPSVLLFIDGLGWRPAMNEIADRIAAAGYHVLMPDLFWRAGAYAPHDAKTFMADKAASGAWWGTLMGTPVADYAKDVATWLTHVPGKVGTTGYCMGGRMSVVAAAAHPERIVVATAWHPGGLVNDKPESPHLHLAGTKAAMFVGAAEDDTNFTGEQQQTLRQAMADVHIDGVVEQFPAKHGWVPTDTLVYDRVQAERHYDVMLGMFGKHLR
jgi:carboxymethylenebutenolidase